MPAVRSEDRRRHQLVVTKRRATALLAVVGVAWLLVTLVGGHATWRGYLQATAEASLVGGLADWFAVTALFRRPLGLPIPHTAIVVERKDQFAATLGEFIQESFLTPGAIIERVRAAEVPTRLAGWLAQPDNAARLAGQVIDAVAAVADLMRDEEIHDAIAGAVRQRLDDTPLAPLAGRVLEAATADGRHAQTLDAALVALEHYLETHREQLKDRFGSGPSPWWLPGAVEDRLFERLLDGARAVLRSMVGDPTHPLRKDLDASITSLAERLRTSPDLRARGEELKADLLGQPQLREWAAGLWSQSKRELRRAADDPDSGLRARVAASVSDVGRRLRDDPELRARVGAGVEQAAAYVAEHFDGEIAAIVSQTIARWDGTETAGRLELLLGPDLQYIRINGTVVGAAAGLVLYAISRIA